MICKILVGLPSSANAVDFWKNVEGAFWFSAAYPSCLVEPLPSVVASLFQFFYHFFNVMLWSFKSGDSSLLNRRVGAEAHSGFFCYAFFEFREFSFWIIEIHVAQSPSSHQICF